MRKRFERLLQLHTCKDLLRSIRGFYDFLNGKTLLREDVHGLALQSANLVFFKVHTNHIQVSKQIAFCIDLWFFTKLLEGVLNYFFCQMSREHLTDSCVDHMGIAFIQGRYFLCAKKSFLHYFLST